MDLVEDPRARAGGGGNGGRGTVSPVVELGFVFERDGGGVVGGIEMYKHGVALCWLSSLDPVRSSDDPEATRVEEERAVGDSEGNTVAGGEGKG